MAEDSRLGLSMLVASRRLSATLAATEFVGSLGPISNSPWLKFSAEFDASCSFSHST